MEIIKLALLYWILMLAVTILINRLFKNYE